MNFATIATLAAIGGVFAFGKDLVGVFRGRRKRISQEEAAAEKQPLEIRRIVMDSTQEAVAVQSTVLLEMRTSLKEKTNELLELRAENRALQDQIKSLKQDLYNAIIAASQARGSK